MSWWHEKAQYILQSFFGLVTRPLEQTPEESVTGAVTAIGLGEMLAAVSRADMVQSAVGSLALVLIWMVVSAVFASPDRRQQVVARNIGMISFWIAVTLALILAAERLVFLDQRDSGLRLEFVYVSLLILVPVYTYRNLRAPAALVMTPAIWASTGLLANGLVN